MTGKKEEETMRLTPKEQEKLMLHMAGNLAKERKERGLKLNYVEALAYISSELLELARDGKTVVELMQLGTRTGGRITKRLLHFACGSRFQVIAFPAKI